MVKIYNKWVNIRGLLRAQCSIFSILTSMKKASRNVQWNLPGNTKWYIYLTEEYYLWLNNYIRRGSERVHLRLIPYFEQAYRTLYTIDITFFLKNNFIESAIQTKSVSSKAEMWWCSNYVRCTSRQHFTQTVLDSLHLNKTSSR